MGLLLLMLLPSCCLRVKRMGLVCAVGVHLVCERILAVHANSTRQDTACSNLHNPWCVVSIVVAS